MALQAVDYQEGLFGHSDGNRDLYSLPENWSWDFSLPKGEQDHHTQELKEINGYLGYALEYQPGSCYGDHDQDPWESSPLLMVPSFRPPTSYSYEANVPTDSVAPSMEAQHQCAIATAKSSTRTKRRRTRRRKNMEDFENQRMTHIAVERNRRKQMNEYLAVLKSLMPDSYVQRGDQASIVGGAINFVKELEQNLHCLSAQKMRTKSNRPQKSLPFGEFFSFPQYSTMSNLVARGEDQSEGSAVGEAMNERVYGEMSSVADVEVNMTESHANLKIRSRKHPKQLINMVTGLQSLRLTILHLNVSTVDGFSLYSFSVKVEDDSNLTTVDEVATAAHQLLGRIQQEACYC